MDVIAELLPPSYLLKSESASKDKRQKSGYRNSTTKESTTEKSEVVETKVAISEWNDVDRRTGKDRRKQMAKRGRWLESRDRNDRRASAYEIFVKI